MAVVTGTLVEGTSVQRPTPQGDLRLGNSSAVTGIQLNAAADSVILDSGEDSNFPYAGQDMQHVIYVRGVVSSCTIAASLNKVNYFTIATVTAADGDTIVRTGNITELPYKYIKVTTNTGASVIDVHSFPALVR